MERFSFTLARDPYLADHQLDGTPFVPLAVLAEELLVRLPHPPDGAVSVGSDSVVGLDDLVLKAPLMLRRGRDKEVGFSSSGREGRFMDSLGESLVEARSVGATVSHASSRAVQAGSPGNLSTGPEIFLSRNILYPGLFFHGSTFQGDFSFRRHGDETTIGRWSGVEYAPATLKRFPEPIATAIVIADLCLQAAGLHAIVRGKAWVTPWTCRVYRRRASLFPGARSFGVRVSRSGEGYLVTAFSADGCELLRWQGLELRESGVPLTARARAIIDSIEKGVSP